MRVANNSDSGRVVRIGGGSAYFADSALGVPQLLAAGNLDYLIFDYLAEASMGLFGRSRQATPPVMFPPDFLTVHIGPHLHAIASQKIRVIANAGALDPIGLARALEERIAAEGLSLKVAAVSGDELIDRADAFRAEGVRDMFTGAAFPDKLLTCNAYLGAFPIAAALDRGADIVITGRVVDSAIVLGPLIHEYGWGADDHDLLAAGTLAGHLLECSTQVTGGTFTDWDAVESWETIGFPIGEVRADGTMLLTKPDGTGGLVSVGTVAEQLLYEVSDPADYIVADVSCDFSEVRLEQAGANRVRVSGAKGRPPTPWLKGSATFDMGWRTVGLTPIIGERAGDKARRQGDALIARGRTLLRGRNLPDFTATSVVVIGEEASFGPRARTSGAREVVMKLTVDHPMVEGAGLFAREQASGISTMSVGTSINLATTVQPLTGLFGFLLPRESVTPIVTMGGESWAVAMTSGRTTAPARPAIEPATSGPAMETVDLIRLAWGRSGDKGSLFNVAIIARDPEWIGWIAAAMTAETVGDWYAHLAPDGARPKVDSYAVPGFAALNFVVHDCLGGGILSGSGVDPAAKTMAQLIMSFPIPVPRAIGAAVAAEIPA
ncbi:MAG: acyclic terpene utilization AtuA family protein [Pseudomonadota bacterium]